MGQLEWGMYGRAVEISERRHHNKDMVGFVDEAMRTAMGAANMEVLEDACVYCVEIFPQAILLWVYLTRHVQEYSRSNCTGRFMSCASQGSRTCWLEMPVAILDGIS